MKKKPTKAPAAKKRSAKGQDRAKRESKRLGKKSKPYLRTETLTWSVVQALTKGPAVTVEMLRRSVPVETFGTMHVIRMGEGRPVRRSSVHDRIAYSSYSPPSLWGAPYTVLLARFESAPPGDSYIQHAGEEMIVPIAGSIQYQFWWKPRLSPLGRIVLEDEIRPGSLARINPQVPHHTWATGTQGATAWMAFRDASEAPTAISQRPKVGEDGQKPGLDSAVDEPQWTSRELSDAGRFGLLAWGIGRQISIKRRASGLELKDVASACDIDTAQLSRIERAQPNANVSIDAWIRVLRFLRVPLVALIENADWYGQSAELPHAAAKSPQPCGPTPPGPHRLHTRVLRIEPSWGRVVLMSDPDAVFSSWIVLDGQLLVTHNLNGGPSVEILVKDSIAHFRDEQPTEVEARVPTTVLQLLYSTRCHCTPSQFRNWLRPDS